MQPYLNMIRSLETRFGKIYHKAKQDHTLRTDLPEKQMFTATLHLMMAVVTRYAIGLAYNGKNSAEELRMQKEMLMQRFIIENPG